MLVLVTRPHEQAAGTARRWSAWVTRCCWTRCSRCAPCPSRRLAEAVAALAVTSINAVPALLGVAPDLPVFAVGEATAAAARAAGRSDVQVAAGDGRALAQLIARRVTPERGAILHLAGAEVRPGLEQALGSTGHRYCRAVVYAAVPREQLAPASSAAIRAGQVDAVLLYSPRSAALVGRKDQAIWPRRASGGHDCRLPEPGRCPAAGRARPACGPDRPRARPKRVSLGCLDAP